MNYQSFVSLSISLSTVSCDNCVVQTVVTVSLSYLETPLQQDYNRLSMIPGIRPRNAPYTPNQPRSRWLLGTLEVMLEGKRMIGSYPRCHVKASPWGCFKAALIWDKWESFRIGIERNWSHGHDMIGVIWRRNDIQVT